MYVLKYMCDACQGTYTVASDGDHLKQLLQLHIPGPPTDHEQPTVAPFIQMGFPSKLRSSLPMCVARLSLSIACALELSRDHGASLTCGVSACHHALTRCPCTYMLIYVYCTI